jgi:5-methylcytosine-specific restriction endonuclease McrA
VPVHPCQLDVDHIDGNRTNSKSSNLQTLCANCHRLKTHMNKDHLRGRDAKQEG